MTDEPDTTRLKVPPWSEEAEHSVIGAVMLDGTVWADVAWLEASAFYRVEHRIIWMAIATLAQQGVALDVTTVDALLRDTMPGRIGPDYLAQIAEATPAASNAVAYADIVYERAARRDIIRTASDLAEAQFATDEKTEATTTTAFEKLSQLSKGRHGGRSKFRRASSLELRGVRWLWDRWLPGGQLTMLAATAFATA